MQYTAILKSACKILHAEVLWNDKNMLLYSTDTLHTATAQYLKSFTHNANQWKLHGHVFEGLLYIIIWLFEISRSC